MIWSDEGYRIALMCGRVHVGAIYPPARRAKVWRWRIWLTESGSKVSGSEPSKAAATRQVEIRFKAFLCAAQLAPEGGGQ
ncbi:hypothetical protein [Sinorhizobium sp. NFACC03]|uniref:hypothetical protein n=1 Tax=Sinorhizobium sp. NFACC03 TaxID=1566295 RepID=UPI0008837088|nr:hypothetical protein [Sinorhizobium sp. NFACC03]SDA39239.1 hypothetical protein SAMN03159448_00168 [Sinorhizobium sp. NFACC03]